MKHGEREQNRLDNFDKTRDETGKLKSQTVHTNEDHQDYIYQMLCYWIYSTTVACTREDVHPAVDFPHPVFSRSSAVLQKRNIQIENQNQFKGLFAFHKKTSKLVVALSHLCSRWLHE